jgi:aquaporin Z
MYNCSSNQSSMYVHSVPKSIQRILRAVRGKGAAMERELEMSEKKAPYTGADWRRWPAASLGSVVAAIHRDFDNPTFESRRLFAEALGTFLLVLVGAGGGTVNAVSHGAISLSARAAAPGLIVLAVILFMGAISGAHLNPAVSVAFAARGDFPWVRVPGYILSQLLGATLACLLLAALFGRVGMLGATEPGPGISDVQAVVIEIVLTAGLVSTILGTASRAQNLGPISAFGVGAYIILAGLWAAPISGASMNPARSFGPDLVLLDFRHFWVYLVGPLVGGLLAVGAAYLLRGQGGDQPAIEAAQGRLGTIFPIAREATGLAPKSQAKSSEP